MTMNLKSFHYIFFRQKYVTISSKRMIRRQPGSDCYHINLKFCKAGLLNFYPNKSMINFLYGKLTELVPYEKRCCGL